MHYLHFFSALTETITAFAATGGYAALFVIILLEGIPLIGIAIPGHVIVISAGFLAATGVLSVYESIAVATIGALLGDVLSFYLGQKYGWPLIEKLRPYFFISESTLMKTREFLENHTGKALFFGRFNPVTRGLMPFFVGSNRLSLKKFFIWNTFGIVVWVVSSVGIGYAIGFGYALTAGWLSRAAAISIIAVLLIIWGYRFVNARFHVFRKYELFALILNILSLVLLVRMLADSFSANPFMANFDIWVNGLVSYIGETDIGSQITAAAAWVSALGGIVTISIFTVAIGMYLSFRTKWRSAAIMLLSVGSTAFILGWLKDIVLRVRPENLITPDVTRTFKFFFDQTSIALDPSFPSGHAAFASAFFIAILYLLTPKFSSWVKRELFIVGCVVLAITIGLSRILLNVHWASDVIAGWALGIFCATSSILFIRYIGAVIEGKIQS